MKIAPLFKWFGSKWQSAARYPAPEKQSIIEPFAGGAGYSLNWCDRNVVIWDLDPHLQVLWPWLISEATQHDILDIPLDLPEGLDIRTLGLSLGQATLLKSWQRTNSVGDCWTVSPWGNKPGQWTANTRARIAEQFEAVRHWTFEEPSCRRIGTWFIDGPYLYNYRYWRGHDAFDFAALAQLVSTLPDACQVIVCEAQCAKTGAIPDYLPFTRSHSSVTSRRKPRQNHHSKELVYIRSGTRSPMT